MADDAQVRLAAFRFLEEQRQLAGEEGVLPRKILVDGFVYEGHRVPLMGPQGIFKPTHRDRRAAGARDIERLLKDTAP